MAGTLPKSRAHVRMVAVTVLVCTLGTGHSMALFVFSLSLSSLVFSSIIQHLACVRGTLA
jgi:hypothetical protein